MMQMSEYRSQMVKGRRPIVSGVDGLDSSSAVGLVVNQKVFLRDG
jgi:hypothetical protein